MEKIAVIIDTNFFGDPEKYDFENIRINTFFNSLKSSSNIDTFIPDIVSSEIKKHIKESLDNDQKNPTSKYFRDYISKDFYKKAYSNAEKKFEKLLKKYNIKTIECNNYINIEDVNKWYFSQQFPFEKAKPKEFPDAMIISALSNYFAATDYNKIYLISNDNGFKNGVNRETNFITCNDINSVRKEIFGYEDNDIFSVLRYLQTKTDIFKDPSIYRFESYETSDEIEVDEIDSVKIGDIDIWEVADKFLTVEVKITAEIEGHFLLFDPYNSIYDNKEKGYCYIVQRECKKLVITDESFFIEIIKDDEENIVGYDDVVCVDINLMKYLNLMNAIYQE